MDGNIVNALGPNATVDEAGLYSLSVSNADGSCTDNVQIQVTENVETLDNVLTPSAGAFTCSVDSIVLSAEADAGAEFDWSGPAGAEFDWVDEPFSSWSKTRELGNSPQRIPPTAAQALR